MTDVFLVTFAQFKVQLRYIPVPVFVNIHDFKEFKGIAFIAEISDPYLFIYLRIHCYNIKFRPNILQKNLFLLFLFVTEGRWYMYSKVLLSATCICNIIILVLLFQMEIILFTKLGKNKISF